MKNLRFILTLFLLFKINNCFAQKDTAAEKKFDRFYISLTGGVGIPVGEFAKIGEKDKIPSMKWPDNQNLADGAQIGLTGKLSASYFLFNYLGWIGTLYTNSFKTTDKTLDAMASTPIKIYYANADFIYDAKSWTANGYMIGLIARIPSEKFIFSAKFLVGSQRTVLPEVNITVTKNFDPYYIESEEITQLSSSYSGFAWNPGIDLQLKIGKKTNVIFSADYTTSNAVFSGKDLLIGKISYFHGNQFEQYNYIYPFKHEKKISYLSLAAGIAYVLK